MKQIRLKQASLPAQFLRPASPSSSTCRPIPLFYNLLTSLQRRDVNYRPRQVQSRGSKSRGHSAERNQNPMVEIRWFSAAGERTHLLGRGRLEERDCGARVERTSTTGRGRFGRDRSHSTGTAG